MERAGSAPPRVQKTDSAPTPAPPTPPPLPTNAPLWQRKLADEVAGTFGHWFHQLESKEKLAILADIEAHAPVPGWANEFEDLLGLEQDPFVLSKLLKVFGRHRGPGALASLEGFLEHEDERIVANTLESLSLSGGTKELERITTFLDHNETRIKSTAARCLWTTEPDLAMKVIRRMATSGKVWEQDAARFALSSCPLAEGLDLLASLEKNIPKVRPSTPQEQAIPPWARLLLFPVHVGLDNPLPLWLFVLFLLGSIGFFFGIALPLVDWVFPPPP
jgi:hypothetical protein